MLYVQMKERLTVKPGTKLTIADLADVIGEKAKEAGEIPLQMRLGEGVWRIPATAVIQVLQPLGEEVTILGADETFVHVSAENPSGRYPFRSVLAFLILFFGSALAISWFHADVGMEEAQRSFVYLISGRKMDNALWMAVPYALGVALGVGGYYALLSKRNTVSPLDIKLGEYRSKAEKTTGRIP